MPTTPPEPLSIAARPHLTRGVSVGALVLHGFGGQTYEMLPWGHSLGDHGYAVEVPLLAGHGTTWQDHATTTWADWYGDVVRAFEGLLSANDVVFVAGLSLGGSLSLQLAADRPADVAGVIVVNPAVDLSKPGSWMTPVAKHVVASVPNDYQNSIKKEGVSEQSYTRTSVKAGHSAMKAMKPLVRALPRITSPLLYFKSTVDHQVGPQSLDLILRGVASREVTVRELDNSYHVATLDNDADVIFDESAAFMARLAGSA